MRLNRLSARFVETTKKEGVHADGGGLYFRVRGPARHWLFVFKWQGRRREMGLGAPPAVGIAKARERAQEARELLADGKDPIAEKRAKRAIPTFGEFADEWIEHREGSVRNDKSVVRWRRTLGENGYAKSLRPLKVDEITTDHVLDVLRPIWSKSETAKLARGYIEGVLDAATARKLRKGENPARWRGHLDHLLPKPQKLSRGHHAALPYADMTAFMAELRAREGLPARALEFMILTAARSGEALGASWGEIDLNAKVWNVPAERMKAGKPHEVPLCSRAVAILTGLRPAEPAPSALVFANGGRQLSNMACPMLLRRMNVEATVHGFRSTFRDWAGDVADFPQEIAEAALAHALGAVEGAYRRKTALEKRRRLMEAWDAYCAGEASGKVVELRRA